MAKVTLSGLEALLNALDKLPDALANQIARKAIKSALVSVVSKIKSACPVDTGALRDSIKQVAGRKKGTTNVIADDHPFVELGTKDTPAQSFMRPTWDSNVESLSTEIQNNIANDVAKELKK